MVTFDISNKVAIITGGASGLGFQYALWLLRKGAKGVTIADVNQELGDQAIKQIESKHGENKAIFVKTDVTNYGEFEDGFKKTIEKFKNVDILINNAGIMNDAIWEKSVAVNVNGVIHGMLLGLDNYLTKYKSGAEAVIVNASSIGGINSFATVPIYIGTKFAVHGMTISWGLPVHYERTKVRVVGVCPGATETPLLDLKDRNLGPEYDKIRELEILEALNVQTPEQVAPGVIQIIEKAPSGTMWVIEGGERPYQYKVPNRFEVPKVQLQ